MEKYRLFSFCTLLRFCLSQLEAHPDIFCSVILGRITLLCQPASVKLSPRGPEEIGRQEEEGIFSHLFFLP